MIAGDYDAVSGPVANVDVIVDDIIHSFAGSHGPAITKPPRAVLHAIDNPLVPATQSWASRWVPRPVAGIFDFMPDGNAFWKFWIRAQATRPVLAGRLAESRSTGKAILGRYHTQGSGRAIPRPHARGERATS